MDEPWPVEGHRVLSVDEAVEALKACGCFVDAFTIQVDGQKTTAPPTEQAARTLDAPGLLPQGGRSWPSRRALQDVKIALIRVRADQW